jgi:AmiR/NasT family two-component response regulator
LIAGAAATGDNEQLRAELQRLKEKLAARTIMDRAKGIIQVRDGCTEAEAYSHLRLLSRSTREPIYEIARRL